MVTRKLWILIGLVALFSACAASGAPQSTSPAQGGTMPIIEQTAIVPRGMIEPLEQAVQDLTARLEITADQVELISLTTQEMAISDLGCPSVTKSGTAEPGGLVLGKEIVLRTGGKSYTYHVFRMRVALCEGTLPKTGTASPALPDASEVALETAMDDLATRLQVTKDAIQITSVETRMWSDASLGCPQPGMMYAQVITPGFLIQLTADGKDYTYHASLNSAVLCEK
jgi:hypothetical protein